MDAVTHELPLGSNVALVRNLANIKSRCAHAHFASKVTYLDLRHATGARTLAKHLLVQ